MSTGLSFKEAFMLAPFIAVDGDGDPVYINTVGDKITTLYSPVGENLPEFEVGFHQVRLGVLDEEIWDSFWAGGEPTVYTPRVNA